ncbi:MAG: hypothetical protein AB8G26_11370 [Ilumatobacter sp.]
MDAITHIQPASSFRPHDAPFSESHRRRIGASLADVSPAMWTVAPDEIRAFTPLIALRGLPSRLLGRSGVADRPTSTGSLLELFESEGFVRLREFDESDRCGVEYGAAGQFWRPAGNRPVHFDSPDAFADFDAPGHAKIWFDLVACRRGDAVHVTTTTLVSCTDRPAARRFAPYWAIIRVPSGLIRRSWLAAIDRRATR